MFMLMMALAATGARPIDLVFETPQPVEVLERCATATMAKVGRVTRLPAESGVDLGLGRSGAVLGAPGSPMLYFSIVDTGSARQVTASYRHPYSEKTATGLLKDLSKRCFPEGIIPVAPEHQTTPPAAPDATPRQ